MKLRILVVDDEAAIRESISMILEYEGYECLSASTGEDAIEVVKRESPDLVFLDIKMPGVDGLETLTRLKKLSEATPVVMISGHGTVSTAVEATKRGAFDFIEKPLARERIFIAIKNALGQDRLQKENSDLQRKLRSHHNLIGSSKGLLEIMESIKRVAPTNATVLIRGESGVGKELVARGIHGNSLRRRERFVQVNCAAIPEDLIESELFGHEKGSFTGAAGRQIGKFEQANQGTIFLDEVGDMSLRAQAKVLRVLQEGEVERLGASQTIKVSVRVLAATNKDLEHEIKEGRFREDLYFRLSVIPIHVPPLRDRREDVPVLVDHFSRIFSEENNFKTKRFSSGALDALSRHNWKGNVRELRNLVERVIIMTPNEVVDVENLRTLNDANSVKGKDDGLAEQASTLREFKEGVERGFLVEKLRENKWNISKTAAMIGTPRSNLYKKLDQYDICQETDG